MAQIVPSQALGLTRWQATESLYAIVLFIRAGHTQKSRGLAPCCVWPNLGETLARARYIDGHIRAYARARGHTAPVSDDFPYRDCIYMADTME